jgi:hypothetical protein
VEPGEERADRPEPGRSAAARPEAGAGPDPAPSVNGRRPRLGGSPADDGDPSDPDEPIWKKHRPPFYYQPRVILAFLIVVLFVGAVALSSRRDTWPPKARCGPPAVASSVGHARTGYPVYWAVTGAATRYAVTIGASKIRVVDGTVRITGTESLGSDKAMVVRQPSQLTGCRVIGHFRMPLPAGEYHLRMYTISGDTAKQVSQTRIDSDG